MKLAELKQKGGFVSAEPVKVPVRWKRGDEVVEFDVHVRRLSAGEFERIWLDPKEKDRSRSASLISACVLFGEKADEPITYKDAFQLEPTLSSALVDAITEATRPKPSPPPTSSGTN
jgi:hypothetical protein